jgi:hypothetical protein
MRAYPCAKCEFIYMGDDAPDGACPACGSEWSPSLEASLVASAQSPAPEPEPQREGAPPRRSRGSFYAGLLLGLGLALPVAGLLGRSLFAPDISPTRPSATPERAGLLPNLTGSTSEIESLRKELQQTSAALEARNAELEQARTDARSAEQRHIKALADLQEAQDELDRLAIESELMQTAREQTFVHTWQVLGPFPNADPPPEGMPVGARVNLTQEYAGMSGQVKWKAFESDNDKLDFGAACGTRDRAQALSACWVHSAADRPIKLSIGSDDGVRVWVNQQSVHENKTQRGASPGQDAARTELKSGWNEILVQVDNIGAGDWALFLEFRSPDNDQPLKLPCTNLPPRKGGRR